MGRAGRSVNAKAIEVVYSIFKQLPVNKWVLLPKDWASLCHPKSLYCFCQSEIDEKTMFAVLFFAGILSVEKYQVKCTMDSIKYMAESYKELMIETSSSKLSLGESKAWSTYYFIARYHQLKANIEPFLSY